jgi:uncharacterized protein (DUF4415 family)
METTMNKEFAHDFATRVAMHRTSAKPAAQPVKHIVTIRLDVDMLDWFKSGGPGYQTRINQILREHMDAHRVEPELID